MISWSNFYEWHLLMLTFRTHDIMIFVGMNGKLTSGNFFWKWIIEMSIRNSCDKIAIEKQKNNNKTIKGRTFSFMSVK